MRKEQKSFVFMVPVTLLAVAACATPGAHVEAKRGLFADPSQFESLASGAYESPLAPTAVAPAVVEAKVAEVKSVLTGKSIDGSTLVSGVETAVIPFTPPEMAERALSSERPAAMTPDLAFSTMVGGNARFVTGAVRGEHRDETRRRAIAGKQNPHSIVLSCSDSRVPPELIFDQGLGDIFTVRVAGNILGSAQVASIEYGIEHLGAKLIVVMGHESCGAVKAALESKPRVSSGSTDIDWMVSAIKPNLGGRNVASVSEDPKLRKPVMANVDAVGEQLKLRSHIISHALAEGKIKIVRGIYSLDSGKVEFWGM